MAEKDMEKFRTRWRWGKEAVKVEPQTSTPFAG